MNMKTPTLVKNPALLQQSLIHKIDSQGMCWVLRSMYHNNLITNVELSEANNFMINYLKELGKYSGNDAFPIAYEYEQEATMFFVYQLKSTLWDTSTEYGQLRCQLFEAVIDNINDNREE